MHPFAAPRESALSRDRKKQQKKKARQDRIRQQKHLRQSQPREDDFEEDEDFEEGGFAGVADLDLPSEYAIERALLGQGGSMLGRLFGWGGGRSARDEAQELAFDALEADDPDQAVESAREALALDPDCVDALCVLAEHTTSSPAEEVALLEKAVAAGERALGGKSFFQANTGDFWGIVPTRPYMRARSALAGALWRCGRQAEACAHLEALLELNPNDNQGNRQELLGMYFLTDNLQGVRSLLERYDDDADIVHPWSRVLERYLSGDLAGARQALEEAQDRNPHVVPYLLGQKHLPRQLPDFFKFGDESEAAPLLIHLGAAWKRHPAALAWLRQAVKG